MLKDCCINSVTIEIADIMFCLAMYQKSKSRIMGKCRAIGRERPDTGPPGVKTAKWSVCARIDWTIVQKRRGKKKSNIP